MPVKKAPLIIAAAVCFVPAAVINTAGAYVPPLFLLLFCALSMLYALISVHFVRLDAIPAELSRFEREASVSYNITVRNRGFFTLPYVVLTVSVESADGFPGVSSEYVLALRPRERLTLTLPVVFPHIGRYSIMASRLRVYGPFGLLFAAKKPKWSVPVHVTPKLLNMTELNLYTSQTATAVDYNTTDKISGSEYSDVRQYSPGDPLKNIHWKLSAHTSDYITRLFKTDAVGSAFIFIDLQLPEGMRASAAEINDKTAECAFAAAARILASGYNAELVYSHANTPANERPRDLTGLTSAVYSLPPVSANERYPIEKLVSESSNGYLSPDNILVVTAADNARLTAVLRTLRARGKRVIICRIGIDEAPYSLEEPS